jgi:5-formyltetrahydrofolate cyclo-ligase
VPPHQCKLDLRRKSTSRLSLISRSKQVLVSTQFRDQLINSDLYSSATTILAYAALPSELNLDLLIQQAITDNKRICIPQIDWASKSMQPAQIRSLDEDLQTGRYGVRTPNEGCPVVEKDEIDLVFVPGLAFDFKGNRLGRGAGFYDRFIESFTLSTRPELVGVCYQCQMIESVPTEPHDYPMDRVITQDGQQFPK